MISLPEKFQNEEALDAFLAEPSDELVAMMKRLDGDIMILGAAGKMGVSMAARAVNAVKKAGVKKKIVAVSRFSASGMRDKLENAGAETISCDLIDIRSAEKLPRIPNIVFMAGRKFGTEGGESLTWAMNTLVPGNIGNIFRDSGIVAFSTGCVYPLVTPGNECTEDVRPEPVGEYSQSCLGRERIFEYCSGKFGTKILLFRLNYAIGLRYGVLHDIAEKIKNGEKVNNTVGCFNVIWQGDANDVALRALEHCASPASILNVTGCETASTYDIAASLAGAMGMPFDCDRDGGNRCYLNDSSKMVKLFGKPSVSLEQMIKWQAAWTNMGGSSFGKPTHFEVNNGKF